jgi:hypothetical protein
MLTGVEILLERMKTNPEEFIEGGYSKWSRVIDGSWSILTEEEQTALKAGVDNAKREHFNGEVMRVLAQGHDELNLEPYTFKGKPLMEGNRPSKVITSQSMMNQATKLLSDEFDKQYDAYKAKGKPHAKT